MKIPAAALLALFAVLVLGAGCRFLPRRALAAPAGGVVPTSSAAAALGQASAAQAAADVALRSRDSRVAAAVREAHTQNEDNAPGLAKDATRAELELADRTLAVEPSTEDKLAAAQRALAKRDGRIEEAARLYGEAASRAEALNRELAQARTARDLAQASAGRALEEAARQIADNTRENQRKLDAGARALADLRTQIADEARQRLLKWLTIAAVVLFVAGVAVAALTQGAAWATAAWLIGGGLATAAAARVIGHWLFPWFAWGAVALATAGGVWWLWSEIRTRRALKVAQATAAELEATTAHVVRQIDAAKLPGADVVALDLGKLGRAMDAKHKATIKRVRDKLERAGSVA